MFALAEEYDFEPPKDRRQAIRWYRMAAQTGLPEAQNALGECLRAGVGFKEHTHLFINDQLRNQRRVVG